MAISRQDCFSLLFDLGENGVDTTNAVKELSRSNDIPIEVIKFINDNRQMDLARFYEKIRKSYNDKKSMLYKNIVTETEDTNTVVIHVRHSAILYSPDVSDTIRVPQAVCTNVFTVLFKHSCSFK